MRIDGKCHCGNIAFSLDWPGETAAISARACGCTFCTKHGGVAPCETQTPRRQAKNALCYQK